MGPFRFRPPAAPHPLGSFVGGTHQVFENHLTERDSNYGLKLQPFFHREYFFLRKNVWEARGGDVETGW